MTESEVDALLDEVRVIRDTTDDPRARQAADLILQDAELTDAERAALFGPGRMHVQAMPVPPPDWKDHT